MRGDRYVVYVGVVLAAAGLCMIDCAGPVRAEENPLPYEQEMPGQEGYGPGEEVLIQEQWDGQENIVVDEQLPEEMRETEFMESGQQFEEYPAETGEPLPGDEQQEYLLPEEQGMDEEQYLRDQEDFPGEEPAPGFEEEGQLPPDEVQPGYEEPADVQSYPGEGRMGE
ncbi:MAG: hypothetical protein Kow0089_02130 [Desulfobulbaceae bacterium]